MGCERAVEDVQANCIVRIEPGQSGIGIPRDDFPVQFIKALDGGPATASKQRGMGRARIAPARRRGDAGAVPGRFLLLFQLDKR